jgi:hypothetical protein
MEIPSSAWALEELKVTSLANPFCTYQGLQFGIHISPRRETFTGHHNHHLLQHPRSLRDELEESNLTFQPLELIEKHLLHRLHNTFNGTSLLQELEIDLASGLCSSMGLQMKSVHKYINEDISCTSNYYNSILVFVLFDM